MIVRKVKPEEIKRTSELFYVSFEFPMGKEESEKSPEEIYDRLINSPKSRGDFYPTEKFAAFLDDDKTMTSMIITTPYNVSFDGASCKMSGIGGVSTLPEYRKSGGIRGCFNAALPYLYENGYEFSYLYPFSTAYYRKFGYELCTPMISYEISLSAITPYDISGGCVLCDQYDSHFDEVKSIYQQVNKKYNMSVIREDYDYGYMTDINPARDCLYTYLYKNGDGTPKGYMTFKKDKNGDSFNLACSNFEFIDIEGLKGLLNFARSFNTYYKKLCFSLPADIEIADYIKEWALYPSNRSYWYKGMARVINVKKILELAKYRGSGKLSIEISDSNIPQNNGIFTVEYKSGKAFAVSLSHQKPDVSMGINDFSRLILGNHDVSQLEYFENVKLFCPVEKLSDVFYKKPIFINDGF